jgi:hypothetical protein
MGAVDLGPLLQPTAGDVLAFNEALAAILRYSPLHRDPRVKMLTIHRLVQTVLRDEMDEALQRVWADRAIRTVNRAFPAPEFKNWAQCERVLPHAQACAAFIE